MQETIFCYKCGKEILKDAEICPNCGCRQNNTLCNTWLITLLLCFFLGSFGAHRFYLKKNASAITMLILTLTIFGAFITSLLFGGMIISLLNFLIFRSFELNYIIEMVFFGVFLGYVIIDSNRIKRLQLAGETSSSLAIMCAMQLYSDFIYIFLRIALIVLNSKSKK